MTTTGEVLENQFQCVIYFSNTGAHHSGNCVLWLTEEEMILLCKHREITFALCLLLIDSPNTKLAFSCSS